MPVEETANMHLMLAAIAQQKGNTTDFVSCCCVHYLHRHFTRTNLISVNLTRAIMLSIDR